MPGRVRLRTAVKYGMVQAGAKVLDKFELVQRLGYDGIELDSPNNLDAQEVLDARDATGLPIHGVVDSVHWGKPFSHPDAKVRAAGVKALETALHDCKLYGGSTVLVVPAVVSKEISYAKAWQRSHDEIARMVPLAEEFGVAIAFENVWNNFLLSPLEAKYYVDSFGSPAVGAYFDVGNIVRYGWPEHWIEALGNRILKLDAKGYSRKKQNDEGIWKGFQVGILEGDNDWPAVIKALGVTGFDSWITAEVGGGGEERLGLIQSELAQIAAMPA